MNKTNLSYWFPIIKAAGLPVPKTRIIPVPQVAAHAIFAVLWGETPDMSVCSLFFDEINAAAEEMGFPCFLRTDQTSGKHEWDKTCFLKAADDIYSHVLAIAEFSEICCGPGLDWSTFAVREFLPTKPFCTLPNYENMPICKEFRFFVDEGKVVCWHPYWPMEAIERGGLTEADLDYSGLCRLENEVELTALAETAGRAVGGAWSIDLLETERGWFLTDMALAKESFHWDGCPNDFSKRVPVAAP